MHIACCVAVALVRVQLVCLCVCVRLGVYVCGCCIFAVWTAVLSGSLIVDVAGPHALMCVFQLIFGVRHKPI